MADPKAAVLIILGQPIRPGDPQRFAEEAANGLARWQTDAVDLPTELLNFLNSTDHLQQIPEIGLRSETGSLFVHILTSCKSKIVAEALRNLTTNVRSPYKHIVFAGNVFSDGGDWSTAEARLSSTTVARHLQLDVDAAAADGDAFKTKVVVSTPTDSWTNAAFSRVSNDWQTVSVNPQGKTTTADFVPADFVAFLRQTMRPPAELAQLLPAAENVGAVGFQRPTFYVFPGGQEDCGLLGVGGFTLLLDGGHARKPGYWDFIRHFDRINALLVSRVSADSLRGVATMFERKAAVDCHPQIGAVIANLPSTHASAAGNESGLTLSVSAELTTLTAAMTVVGLSATPAFASAPKFEPIVLYKVFGQGRLEMVVMNPPKDAKELQSLSAALNNPNGSDAVEKLAAATALAVLLVWHPDDPKVPTTRVFYPGACPLERVYPVLEKLNKTAGIDYLKQPEFVAGQQHAVQAQFAANKKPAPSAAAARPAPTATAKPAASTRLSLTAQKKPEPPANQKKPPTAAAASTDAPAQLKKATTVGGAASSTARRPPPPTASTAAGAAKKPTEPAKKAPAPARPTPAAASASAAASKKPASAAGKDSADKADKNGAKPKPIRKPSPPINKDLSPPTPLPPVGPADAVGQKEDDHPPTPTQPAAGDAGDHHDASPSPPADGKHPTPPVAPTPGDATDGHGGASGGHDDVPHVADPKQPSPTVVVDDIEPPCVRMTISMDTEELEKELGLPALDATQDDSHMLVADTPDSLLIGSQNLEMEKMQDYSVVLDQESNSVVLDARQPGDHEANATSSSSPIEEKETARAGSEMEVLLLQERDGGKSPVTEGIVRSISGGDDHFAQHLRLQDPYPGMFTPAHNVDGDIKWDDDTSFFSGQHDESAGGSVRLSNEHTDLTHDFNEKVVLTDAAEQQQKPTVAFDVDAPTDRHGNGSGDAEQIKTSESLSPVDSQPHRDSLESSYNEAAMTVVDQRRLDVSTLSSDELKDNSLLDVDLLLNAAQMSVVGAVEDSGQLQQQREKSPVSIADNQSPVPVDDDKKSPTPTTPSMPGISIEGESLNTDVADGAEMSFNLMTPLVAPTPKVESNNSSSKPDDVIPQTPSQPPPTTAAVDELKTAWGEPLGLPPPPPPTASVANGAVAKKTTTTTTSNAPSTSTAATARRLPPRSAAAAKPAGPPPARSSGMGRPASAAMASATMAGKALVKSKPALSSPIYVDVAYIPHHGDKVCAGEEFFELVRAKYYVLSVTEVGASTLDAWMTGKRAWKRPDLASNLVPTYDCDALSLWIREHEDQLADENMDVRPSAERCELTMQRAGSEPCAAYKIEL